MSVINSVSKKMCSIFYTFFLFSFQVVFIVFLVIFSFSSKKGKGKKFKWIKFGTNVDLSDERK